MPVVYQYGCPPFSFGAVDAVVPFAFAIYEGVDQANLGAHEGMGMLLIAAPYDPDLDASPTIYPAATHGSSASTFDVPSDTYVPSSLRGEISLGAELFAGADPMSVGAAGAGSLMLIDPAGELDGLLALGWDGAAIELKRGTPGEFYSTWETVARLTASGMLGDLDQKEIALRDLAWTLTTANLHDERYAGTGLIEGDATLKGVPKPYCAGYVINITPVPINTTALIFQISYTSIAAVSAVRDGGAALAFSADYASYAALAAAVVTGGQYATCLAKGLIRLGATPDLDVTCDVTGDADVFNGTPGPTTRAGVVRRIATGIGSQVLDDSEQIDGVSFGSFDGQQPAAVGWYWTQQVSKADAINEVLKGCLGFWLVTPGGQLTIGVIDDPAAVSPALILSYPASDAGEVRLGPPRMTATLPPRRGTFVGWGRNYTVQQRSQLAGTVTEANVQLYGQATRYASDEDATIAANYPTSPTVYIEGGYRDEADALAEAERQQALMSVPRARWSTSLPMDPLASVVGKWSRIDNLNRMGWGAAKSLLCCGINATGNDVELQFWG